jgi:hypothetical protein
MGRYAEVRERHLVQHKVQLLAQMQDNQRRKAEQASQDREIEQLRIDIAQLALGQENDQRVQRFHEAKEAAQRQQQLLQDSVQARQVIISVNDRMRPKKCC